MRVEHAERLENVRAPSAITSTSPSGLRHAEQLDVDLVELAEAALLRPLVAEHRAGAEELQRQAAARARWRSPRATMPAVASGRSVISSPPRSVKVYISLVTMSVVSPIVRAKTSVNSKIGVAIS